MCVIANIQTGKTLPSFHLFKRAWDANPHGAGFMYPRAGRLVVVKGLMTFTQFKDTWGRHRRYFSKPGAAEGTGPVATADVCVHFRIRSHGASNAAMTHPHEVQGGVAIAHNGIIHGLRHDAVKSDTVVYIEDVLNELPLGWQRNAQIRRLLQDDVGRSNKIVIYDHAGWCATLNHQQGADLNGVWWSNRYHLAAYHISDEDIETTNRRRILDSEGEPAGGAPDGGTGVFDTDEKPPESPGRDAIQLGEESRDLLMKAVREYAAKTSSCEAGNLLDRLAGVRLVGQVPSSKVLAVLAGFRAALRPTARDSTGGGPASPAAMSIRSAKFNVQTSELDLEVLLPGDKESSTMSVTLEQAIALRDQMCQGKVLSEMQQRGGPSFLSTIRSMHQRLKGRDLPHYEGTGGRRAGN